MAAVARAARPVARAAAGRYGAALASRCARGVISRQDRGRYKTRADAREASDADNPFRLPPGTAFHVLTVESL